MEIDRCHRFRSPNQSGSIKDIPLLLFVNLISSKIKKIVDSAFTFTKVFQNIPWIYEKHFQKKYYSIKSKMNLPVSNPETSKNLLSALNLNFRVMFF